MKVTEITEGWGDAFKSAALAFGRGMVGAQKPPTTFVQEFVKKAQDGIRTGIQTGTITPAVAPVPEAIQKPVRPGPFKRAVPPRPTVAAPITLPAPRAPEKTQSISSYLMRMVTAYMGPGSYYSQGGAVDISGVKDVIKKQIAEVERTYRNDQGKNALTALGNTLYTAAKKSRDDQPGSPSRISTTDLTK